MKAWRDLGSLALSGFVWIVLLLLCFEAAAHCEPPLSMACTARQHEVYDVKTKQTTDVYSADCTLKDGQKVLWAGPLVLAADATRIDALLAIDHWMKVDAPKIAEEHGIKLKK